jgi:hypothetical protein
MAWVVLAGMLCLGAVIVTALCAEGGGALSDSAMARALDWQAALGLREPWRLWTCAWVHWSAAHLAINLVGGLVVAFVGWRARLDTVATGAWLAAWPLTQVVMAALGADRVAAAMPHYGGLSGVLHAGVIVLGLSLAWPRAGTRPPAERWIGVAIVAGTLVKVVLEAPWHLELRPSDALGIAVAPVAHACGIAAGLLAWSVAQRVSRSR